MMHIGVMLFQHPVDIAVVARKSEEFGLILSGSGNTIMPGTERFTLSRFPRRCHPRSLLAGSSILLWRWRGPLP